MFRYPSFSGSSAGHLEAGTANVSEVSADEGNPGQSAKASWYWKSTEDNRWLRLTTFNASLLPNPTIDLTKPIRMDILLLEIVPPDPPTLVSPLEEGDTTVRVTDVLPDATQVYVYANDMEIGSIDPAGADTVDVPVSGLLHLDAITAKQLTGDGLSGSSSVLEVGKGNGDILVSIGIRETGDAGPLGSQGGSAGDLEWIGASEKINGAPQGKPLSPANAWQTLTFDPANDPITSFLGDGEITETRGTIEHLAVAVNAASSGRSTGAYRMYVDNVVNVGADVGGGDFVIADFESFDVGDEVLFQEPTFSGSTGGDLSYPPSFSGVSATYGNPGQSERLDWFWVDTDVQRWARITTASVGNVSYPIVDLTKPIRMDILLMAGCETFVGDLDGDNFVTIADFNLLAGCMVGPQTPSGLGCVCGDFNEDGDVDMYDFADFQTIFGN
jgi:hypothetical protein